MEAQAKILADLIATVSSMNAKLDDLHPVVLELNQCRPGVERAADALRAEVGDLRARVVDTTHPAEPPAGTDMPPPFLLSADAPSSSSKPASAQTGSSPDQDALSTSMSVTTVELLREQPAELVPMSAALRGYSSSASIVKETLGVDPSAATSFITMAHSTCSTVCLPRGNTEGPLLNQPPWPPPQIETIWWSCKGVLNGRQSELKPWPDELQHQRSGSVFPLPPLQKFSGHSPLGKSPEFFGNAASFDLQIIGYFVVKGSRAFEKLRCADTYSPKGTREFLQISVYWDSLSKSTLAKPPQEPKCILLYVSKLVASKLLGMFLRFEHWWNYMLQAWPTWRSYGFMEQNTIAGKNSYLLLLPWVSGQAVISDFAKDGESWGSGELTQWLISNLFGDCFLSNMYGSDISSINRLYPISKAGFQVVTVSIFHESMLELQLTSNGNSWVCVHELPLARSGMEGTAPRRVFSNMRSCQLQCEEAICAYPEYCPSFSSANKGSVWEGRKLELNNWVSYTVAQYTAKGSIGIKTGFHSSGESTSKALMQGISHSDKESYRGLLFLQNEDGDNGVATMQQSGNLVVRTDVPWNPGGSIWHWWFSTCYDQDLFQGGRHAIAVTISFEQVSAGDKYYLDSDDIRASAGYNLGAFFDWVPVDHDFYVYLSAVYPDSGYYFDSDRIKDRWFQWDPGGQMPRSINDAQPEPSSIDQLLQWKHIHLIVFLPENGARTKYKRSKDIRTYNANVAVAAGISHCNKEFELATVAKEVLILQNQGSDWISHGSVLMCHSRATLLSAQCADDDLMATSNQCGVLVQRMEQAQHMEQHPSVCPM